MSNKSQMSKNKETRYLKTIDELEEQIKFYSKYYYDNDDPYIQAMNALDNYHKVFSWLNEQEWYMNHRHEVNTFINSIVYVVQRKSK